jgi:hypothetical protein
MVWLYIYSDKSVFVVAVFHAMTNLCWQLFPNDGSLYDPRVFGLITLCLALAILSADRLRTRSNLRAA